MWTWGLEILLWLEQFRSPVSDTLVKGITSLGSAPAYLAVVAAIYICVDHRFGFRVMVMFLLSAHANAVLKVIYHTPRPYMLHPDLPAIWAESGEGNSFPSGHAQNSTVIYGIVTGALRSPWWRVGFVALVAVIGLSRLYLEVHWPIDIVGGALIGCALLGGYLGVSHLTSGWRLDAWRQVALVLAAAAAMLAFMYVDKTCARTGGALIGGGIGYVLLQQGGYRPKAPWKMQALKLAVTFAVLAIVKGIGDRLLGDSEVAKVVMWCVMGFAVTYALPATFRRYIDEDGALRRRPTEVVRETP